MPSRDTRAKRPDDKRLAANMPPERRRKTPIVKSRYQKLMDGELTVADLDDEEIMAGKCKDKNGKFSGRPPASFPRALHDALRREFHERMNKRWQAASEIGPSVLLEIAQNKRASADARVKAAVYLTERVMGKVPDKIEQTIQVKAFEENIEQLLVDVPDKDNVTSINRKKKTG